MTTEAALVVRAPSHHSLANSFVATRLEDIG